MLAVTIRSPASEAASCFMLHCAASAAHACVVFVVVCAPACWRHHWRALLADPDRPYHLVLYEVGRHELVRSSSLCGCVHRSSESSYSSVNDDLEKLPLAAHLDRTIAAPKPPQRAVQAGTCYIHWLPSRTAKRFAFCNAERAVQLAQFCMLTTHLLFMPDTPQTCGRASMCLSRHFPR
jgi:hypothetical protein